MGNMKEQIIHRWNPHEEITPYISLNEMKQTHFDLLLSFTLFKMSNYNIKRTGKIATFKFKNPFAVRYSIENDRIDLIKAKHIDNGSIIEKPIWPLFIIENSTLLKWQKDLGAIVEYDEQRLTCYAFTEEEYLIEILCEKEPQIQIENE